MALIQPLSRGAGLAQAYYGGSGTTIGLWSYTDEPLVQKRARLWGLGTFHAYGTECPQ
jgi:hypothetical protein